MRSRIPARGRGGGLADQGWLDLDKGPLIVVQSLTTMSLVIALPLGRRITDQEINRRVWLGALAMVAAIVLFLSVGSPQGGTASPPAAAWWSAGLSSLVLVAVLANFGRHHRGAAGALLFGSAAGVGFALQAAVTKVFVTLVGQGLSAILPSWTIWVLIASALAGFVLQQSALKTGVLAAAMASSKAVTLFASVVFGITIFGETLSSGGGRLAPALIGLAIALVGIVLLAGAKPPQRAEPAGSPEQPRADPA